MKINKGIVYACILLMAEALSVGLCLVGDWQSNYKAWAIFGMTFSFLFLFGGIVSILFLGIGICKKHRSSILFGSCLFAFNTIPIIFLILFGETAGWDQWGG